MDDNTGVVIVIVALILLLLVFSMTFFAFIHQQRTEVLKTDFGRCAYTCEEFGVRDKDRCIDTCTTEFGDESV